MKRRSPRMYFSCLLAISALWAFSMVKPLYAQGQLATANLTGQVMDSSGALIPGANVGLQSKAGGTPMTTITNEAGVYRFSFLRPGSYSLTAKKSGFADVVISDITLQVEQTANVNVEMRPGAVVQQITVSAAAVALESQTSSLGGVVDNRAATQLPLIFRDPTQLVNLVPGVTADHRNPSGALANADGLSYQGRLDFVFNGGTREQVVGMVDGIDITNNGGFFTTMPIIVSSDFTQEFKVQTNNLSAEFGRGTGVVNIVTRSGSNQYHGTVFEFLQNDRLNAQDLFANAKGQKKPALRRNQYGFAVGGPIIKDKTWFFADWERLRQMKFSPILMSVPTDAQRRGDFSGLYTSTGAPMTIYNPFDLYKDPTTGRTLRRPFPNNQIPANMMNAFGIKMMSFYPQPNTPGILGPQGQYTGINNYALGASAPLNFNKLDIKIDHNLGISHRFMGRYSQSLYRILPVDVFHNAANPTALSTRDNTQPGKNAVLSWTWTTSPTLMLTNAVNFTRFTDKSVNPSFGFDLKSLGGPFASGSLVDYVNRYDGGTSFPEVIVGSYVTMGNSYGNTYVEPFYNYSYQFGLAKTRGRHTLKAGYQLQVLQSAENFFVGSGGSFPFSGRFSNGPDPLTPTANTGRGGVDLLLGLVNTGGYVTSGYTQMNTSKYHAWYFQDDFRVTNKLTLNLGLRYDFQRPVAERFNHRNIFDWNVPNPLGAKTGPNTGGQTLDQYFQSLTGHPLMGGLLFPSSPQAAGRGIVPTEWGDISPRLGFAYQISNKLVMRGGFSKLYMLSLVAAGVSGNGGGTINATTPITGTIDGISPSLTIDNPFPAGFNTAIYDSQGLLSIVGLGLTAGNNNPKTPYQWQWNFGFEYELPRNAVLSVAYGASRGRQLTCPFRACGDQVPYTALQKYGSQVLNSVPNPFYGIITDPTSALSKSTVQLGQLLKAWPQYTSVTLLRPPYQGISDRNLFQSSWDALEVGVQKRYSQGLSLIIAYTASKNITNSDTFEGGYLGPVTGYERILDLVNERSLSAEDVAQRLVISHVYDLPFGHQKRFGSNWHPALNQIAGGWQLSGNITLASGFPLPVGVSGLTTGAFGGNTRPDAVPGVNACLDNGRPRGQRISQYVTSAAFSRPANFTFGNAPRLLPSCRGDGIKNYDFSAIKFFPITERFKLEFRSEFFNFFNRPRLGNPNMTWGGASYGIITSQQNLPRVIQLALKVNF